MHFQCEWLDGAVPINTKNMIHSSAVISNSLSHTHTRAHTQCIHTHIQPGMQKTTSLLHEVCHKLLKWALQEVEIHDASFPERKMVQLFGTWCSESATHTNTHVWSVQHLFNLISQVQFSVSSLSGSWAAERMCVRVFAKGQFMLTSSSCPSSEEPNHVVDLSHVDALQRQRVASLHRDPVALQIEKVFIF